MNAGLPIGYKQKLLQKSKSYDNPFQNFLFENNYSDEDCQLSQIIMTYFSNFIKTGYQSFHP